MTTDFIATAKAMPDFVVHDLPPCGPEIVFFGGPLNGKVIDLRSIPTLPPDYPSGTLVNIFNNEVPIAVHKSVKTQQQLALIVRGTRFAMAFGVS